METISIALLCTVIGCVIGIGTYSKTRDKDIRADAERWGVMSAKLDFITTTTSEIKTEGKLRDERMNKEMSDVKNKLTEVEQSTKSAHHRIDELVKEKDGM